MKIFEILKQEPIFYTEKGRMYVVHSDGTTTRFKAARAEHPGEQGQQPRSQSTFYASKHDIDEKLSIYQAEGDGVKVLISARNGYYAIRYETGPHKGKYIRSSIIKPLTNPAIGLVPVEVFKDGHFVHFGNKITKMS